MSETRQKKRTFRKFAYRGIDLEKLLDYSVAERYDDLMTILNSRQRRRFNRGLSPKHASLLKKVLKAKAAVSGEEDEKPETVRTHLRDMIIVPEMIGSVVGVYNGHSFTHVEIKAGMVGHYLAEFSITYKPVGHGRPGLGSSAGSKFVPLK